MKYVPLARLIRPKTLNEVIGQPQLLAPNAPFRKLIESGKLTSFIFYGPAGCGKTTLAEIIASYTKSKFISLSATSLSVKDLRREGLIAKESGINVIIFIDECYRLSRNQEDALLPFIENGDIIFIGCSTENPFHSVSSPLLSRSQIFQLEPLKPADLIKIIQRGIKYYKSNGRNIIIEPAAAKHVILTCCGDARKALTILEMSIEITEGDTITLDCVKTVSPNKYMIYSDDIKYDYVSWLQNAIQFGDPDGAIFALAAALEASLDPRFLARRIMVSASEDCAGNPEVAAVAHSAYIAACEIGRPECDIILAHAVTLAASCPRDKSSAFAIWDALKDVREKANVIVPKELRDGHYTGAVELGHGTCGDGTNSLVYKGINKVYYRPPLISKYKNPNI